MHSANFNNNITIAERVHSLKKDYWISWAVNLAAMISLLAWFCNTVGIMPYIYACSAGVVILLLAPMFETKHKLFAMIVAIAVAVMFLFAHQKIIEGVKIIGNRIFSISEALQAYRYDRLEVGVPEAKSDICMLVALAFISGLLALISMLLMRKRKFILPLASFATVAIFTAYFGVSAAFIWMVLPATLCLIAFIPSNAGTRRYVAIVICMVILFTVSSIFLPKELPSISKLDESIRDKIAFETVRIENESTTEDFDPPPVTEPEEKAETMGEHIAYFIPTVKTVLVVAVSLLILLILFIPAVLNDRLRKRAAMERADFENADHSVSICAMFLYAAKWLNACGLGASNINYAEWTQKLGEYMSYEYLGKYDEIVPIWYEAAFSSHEMTVQQRNAVWEFLKSTSDEIWHKASRKQRLLIKYRYGLVLEEQ